MTQSGSSDWSLANDLRRVVGGSNRPPLSEDVYRSRNPIWVRCPSHNDSRASYAIYPDGAYCFVCGYSERFSGILERLESDEQYKEHYFSVDTERIGRSTQRNISGEPEQRYEPLVRYWNKTLLEGPRQHRLRYLLEKRGLLRSTVERYLIGHTGDYFSIPIISQPGNRVTGYKLRRDDSYCYPDEPKYRNSSGGGGRVYRPNPEGVPTIICEGEFDALLVSQFGADGITSTAGAGSLFRFVGPLLNTRQRTYLAIDRDEPGLKAESDFRAAYPSLRTLNFSTTDEYFKDISDFLVAQDYPASALNKLIREAT